MLLGIDPANEGGAVLLDDYDKPAAVYHWRQVTRNKQRVYKLSYCTGNRVIEVILADAAEIGLYIGNKIRDNYGAGLSLPIVSEDAYINPRSPNAGRQVAKRAGMIVGGVRGAIMTHLSTCPITWVMASQWRKDLLDVPHFTKRAKCKEASLSMVPILCPEIVLYLDLCGQLDHITDACGVALWAIQESKK